MQETESKKSNWPHGGVQGDAFRVVQLLVQEGDTCLSIFVTHEDPVIHVIHKVEVSGEPVDGHLLHIWTEKGQWGEELERWNAGGVRKKQEQCFSVLELIHFYRNWTWACDALAQACSRCVLFKAWVIVMWWSTLVSIAVLQLLQELIFTMQHSDSPSFRSELGAALLTDKRDDSQLQLAGV